MSLVHDIREQIAIGNHPRAAGEGRSDHLTHKLGPGCHIEEHLGSGVELQIVAIEEDRPDGVAHGRRTGISAGHDLATTSPEPVGEPAQLRRLARAVHSVEHDESR